MFITVDTLIKHAAFTEDVEEFIDLYPDGAEALTVINDKKIDLDFLHWIFEYLELDKEEEKAYWLAVDVKDSAGVRGSTNVSSSELVVDSKDVGFSRLVYSSEFIDNSQVVVDSRYTDYSTHIYNSDFVSNSNKILDARNVTNSNEVVGADYVMDSYGVFDSKNIVNCHTIWKGENQTDCAFCFGCQNLINSLFCIQITDGEYYLFNKKIDKNRYEMIYKQYHKYMKAELHFTDGWPDGNNLPTKSYDYRKHLADIPDSFWAWVRTLPGYSSDIMYSLTFNPQFLT